MTRIAIVGTRTCEAEMFSRIRDDVAAFVAALPADTIIVSGGAVGVDSLARHLARKHGLRLVEFLPDYIAHGQKAPLIRNQQIVSDCDEVHAWPGPESRGTWHTVKLAQAMGRRVVVHEPWKVPT